MGSNFSKEGIEWLEEQMHIAEPYDDDDPVMLVYDIGDKEPLRWNATMARRLLRQAGELKDEE